MSLEEIVEENERAMTLANISYREIERDQRRFAERLCETLDPLADYPAYQLLRFSLTEKTGCNNWYLDAAMIVLGKANKGCVPASWRIEDGSRLTPGLPKKRSEEKAPNA